MWTCLVWHASTTLHWHWQQCLWIGRLRWWSPFLRRGTRGYVPHSPWKDLCRGAGEESPSGNRISDSGGAGQFMSGPWNRGPALDPQQGTWRCMGVCPIFIGQTIHVFCLFGGVRPCPSEFCEGYVGRMVYRTTSYGQFGPCTTNVKVWSTLPAVSWICF